MFKLENINTLQIELTNRCNAACPACARTVKEFGFDSKKHFSEIGLDQFKGMFNKEFLKKKVNKIIFCGAFGDAIIAKDLIKIIEYIKSCNPKISISVNTNGSMRNKVWWTNFGKLMSRITDCVVFSIDGLEDTNHIYRVNTDFKKIVENVKAFISAGGRAHWDMLIFDYNEHQVIQCEELAKNLGFKYFRSKVSSKFISDTYKISFDRAPSLFKIPVENKKININCIALNEKTIYISSDGTVLPCCFLADRMYTDHISESHPDILPRDQLNLKEKKFENIIPLFTQVTDTWNSDNPVDVCKQVCNYTQQEHAYYKEWIRETEF